MKRFIDLTILRPVPVILALVGTSISCLSGSGGHSGSCRIDDWIARDLAGATTIDECGIFRPMLHVRDAAAMVECVQKAQASGHPFRMLVHWNGGPEGPGEEWAATGRYEGGGYQVRALHANAAATRLGAMDNCAILYVGILSSVPSDPAADAGPFLDTSCSAPRLVPDDASPSIPGYQQVCP